MLIVVSRKRPIPDSKRPLRDEPITESELELADAGPYTYLSVTPSAK